MKYSKAIPVIINTRDLYSSLVKQIRWLEKIGHKRIVLIDNDSSYPPLLKLFEKTPYQVIRLGRNGMHKAPWESMGVRFSAKDSPYILTDPDVIPIDECPPDAIEHFSRLLNKYKNVNKVGFGLKIDDLPDHFSQKNDVIVWESRYWASDRIMEKDVYDASIDTTMCLYRPHTSWFLDPSIRTGGNYIARHDPWYQDSLNPTDDYFYYSTRASRRVSTWGLGKLPKHHINALKNEGFLN